MKKSRLLFLLAPLVLFPLNSCSSKSVSLTFGTYVEQNINSLQTLSNSELLSKTDRNEVFLLAVYQGSYSETCDCWITFKNIIASYMNTYHEYVYLYNAQKQDESISHLKIEKIADSSPFLYVFEGEKQLAKFYEKIGKDEKIFTDTSCSAMEKRVHKVISKPKAYFVDDSYLKENLAKKDESIVLFMRSKCDDCSYVLPRLIIPYINRVSISKNLWLFDMQNDYEISQNEAASKTEKEHYQNIKDYYGLSLAGNSVYGYNKGVVPTIQYYEDGVLKDASVFFNDSIDQKEDGSYYVSDSFYTEERLVSLKYLKDAKFTTCLKGLTIEPLFNEKGIPYWPQEKASEYHTPILNAFLTYYLN